MGRRIGNRLWAHARQPGQACGVSVLTGCLPVPAQLLFAEEHDLKVDLFILSFFFFFNEWT